ncbi:hypothetical protein SDC9_147686 [bioreactor metagenome]|uniref:Uncharacterized protein n=1 Tax=bioreactor metagenome TaxID=1076179 RepID=A0A645EF24_9ZZZZ
MFGRSKLLIWIKGSFSPSRRTISSRVVSSAVAVSATNGSVGKRCLSWPSAAYSGRKSCPHCEIQCASSTASSNGFQCARCSRKLSSIRRSGAIYSRRICPVRHPVITSSCCSRVCVEFRQAAATPFASSWST